GGSSAGGYLTMMLCFNSHFLNQLGVSQNQISGYIHDTGQPTVHFSILKEFNIDPRRVIIDDKSPLYYVGSDNSYPRMLFLVSDNDIPNRLEQTNLMISTLKQFGFHEPQVQLKIMHSEHCAYLGQYLDDGTNIFGQIVVNFIKS